MQEYLLAGGFIEEKLNNRKNGSYLYNKLDEEHYVVYLKDKCIKHYMKRFFGITLDIYVDEMFIMKYGNIIKFKIIQAIDCHRNIKNKLQKIPYIKQYYDIALGQIGTVEYAINIDKINDNMVLDIVKSCGIYIFNLEDDYQNKLDIWLDS